MVTTLKALLSRVNRPPLHWSALAADGGVLPGGRIVDPEIGGCALAWPSPVVIGGGAIALSEPIGVNARNLVVFEGARLIDQNGIIELADGSWLAEPAWHPNVVNPWLLRRERPARLRRLRGPWFSCLLEFSYNYYHWVCDVLPRLHRVLDRLPAPTRFVVPDRMAPWQWDSLAALGIPASRCAALPREEAWSVDELYYSGPAAACGDHDPRAIAWVRDTIAGAIGGADAAPRRRLYVTRRLTRRSIVNEDAHWPLLAAAGFDMIEAERMSFADQVRAFRSAACVIAPHGAGLANITWCAAPATVVEIVSPSFATQRCIWTLASALGHRHAIAVIGEADTPARDLMWQDADVRQMLSWALA